MQGLGEVADEANEANNVEDLVRAEAVDIVDDDNEAFVQHLEHGAQLLMLLKYRWCRRQPPGGRLPRPGRRVPAPTTAAIGDRSCP